MKNIIYILFPVFFAFSLFCQENKGMGSPCKFTVMKGNDTIYHLGSIPVISGDTTYLCEGDSFSLQLWVHGAGCSCNSLQWKKNGVSIPNATSYALTVADTGQYTFDIFCSPTMTVWTYGPVIQVMACAITGIKENSKNNFALFPNPSTGKITIRHSQNIERIMIRNVLGEVVYNLVPFIGDSLSFDQEGVYFITISSSNQIITKKLVVQR